MDLLTVGEAFDDLVFAGLPRLPVLGEELRVDSASRHPGGGALITAIAAARLGATVGILSALSRDNVSALRREQVSIANLRTPAERTAVTVALSTPGDRAFVTFEGVNTVLGPRLLRALSRLRRRPRHAHFALVPRGCRAWLPVLRRLKARGTTTSWDFGWHEDLARDRALPDLLALLDWVFVNDREATLYSRTRTLSAAYAVWRRRACGVVVKRGAQGAVVLADGQRERIAASKTTVVDTTGAGDAFNAGFLAACLKGAPPAAAARLGNFVGSRSVRAVGGIDGLPHLTALPRWAQRLLERP